MKAIVYDSYGGPEVLKVRDISLPRPKPNEVLIRVRAVEVTKADCELRSFRFAVKWFWLPLRLALGVTRPRRRVLGCYFAGEVDAIGSGVTQFNIGDRLFGCANLRMGAYAERLCLPARYPLAAMPENADFPEAAALPLGGLNALHFLNRANLRAGASVLIVGAGGSIGLFALQMAKSQGARVTVVDKASKEAMLRSAGADAFIDYQQSDVPPPHQRFDVILSTVAGSNYSRFVDALNAGGHYLIANPRLSDMLRSVWTSRFTDRNVVVAFAPESREQLLALKTLFEDGAIRTVLDSVLPIDRIVDAHERVETEQRLGAVIVVP